MTTTLTILTYLTILLGIVMVISMVLTLITVFTHKEKFDVKKEEFRKDGLDVGSSSIFYGKQRGVRYFSQIPVGDIIRESLRGQIMYMPMLVFILSIIAFAFFLCLTLGLNFMNSGDRFVGWFFIIFGTFTIFQFVKMFRKKMP